MAVGLNRALCYLAFVYFSPVIPGACSQAEFGLSGSMARAVVHVDKSNSECPGEMDRSCEQVLWDLCSG